MKPVKIPRKQVNMSEQNDHENYYTQEVLKKFLKPLDLESNYMKITFFNLLSFTGIRKGETVALN